MSKISLRTYYSKVEKLIDQGIYDDAIRHSRFILKTYPKCIGAYRILAKALLEKKEYPEAKDIFARILSVYPDDFVSHIGLSIIQENEGNLDAAIWHMELAYDIQPSNPVLTEELRRLFGRRDGVQPPKIRMTRGALIRMYARGELYLQAISECQSALRDDPRRIDIELILARMNFLSGALVESAEICSRILARMPYCFEANRLMTEIIPRTGQAEAAAIYRSRLTELDPYFGHVTSPEMDSADIPDGAVLLEYLEENPQLETPELPVWSSPMKFDWEDTRPIKIVSNDVPTQLDDSDLPQAHPANSSTVAPAVTTGQESETSEFESIQRKIDALDKDTGALYDPQEIPDWIRNAGWGPSTGATEEQLDNSTLSTENGIVRSEEAEPAFIPDWLQNTEPDEDHLAGAEDSKYIPSEEEPPASPETSFTNDEIFEQAESSESAVPTSDPEFQNPIPAQGETGDMMPSDSINKNEDEWLNQFRDDSTPKGEQNDLPDWLKDFESENEQPLEENMDIPEWLKSLEPVEPAKIEEEEVPQPLEQVPPVEASAPVEKPEPAITSTSYVFTKMLSEDEARAVNLETTLLQPEPEPPVVNEVTPPIIPQTMAAKSEPETSPALPAWVRNILKPHTPPAPSVEVPVESTSEKPETVPQEEISAEPVSAIAPSEEIQMESTPPEIPAVSTPEAVQEPPVILGEEPIQELSTPAPAEGAISSEASSELLDWLRGFGENEEQTPEVEEPEETPVSEPEMTEVSAVETPIDRLETYVEPAETFPPVPEPEIVEEDQPISEESAQPVVEEPVQPLAEKIAAEQETAWIEELPAEVENLAPIEAADFDFASEEVSESTPEEMQPAEPAQAEEPQAVIEEPISEEPVVVPVMEPATPDLPVVPDPLSVAKNALAEGDLDLAVNEFNMALQDETKIPELIDSLKIATIDQPENTDLWQLLGDAYARTNQFGDAFAAYDKVETLLLTPQ